MAFFSFTSTLRTKLNFVILLLLISVLQISAQNHTATKVGNAIVSKQMQWLYGDYRFTLDIPLNSNTYYYYKKQSKRNSYASYASEHNNYQYLSQVAKKLSVDAKELGYTGWKLVEYLTAFVQQNITYTKDPYNNGSDYPKFPIETLMEKKGDCEDSAILLISLLKLFGFNAVLIQLPSHMAVGISCSNCKSYYNFEGKKYAYIETTNPKWNIGDIPSDYKKASAQLIKTPDLKHFKDTTIKPLPKKSECTCKPQKQIETIVIKGRAYAIKPNETIVISDNGLKITISN